MNAQVIERIRAGARTFGRHYAVAMIAEEFGPVRAVRIVSIVLELEPATARALVGEMWAPK